MKMEKLIVYFLQFLLSYSSKPSELSISVNSPLTRSNETNPGTGVSFAFHKCLIIILHTCGSRSQQLKLLLGKIAGCGQMSHFGRAQFQQRQTLREEFEEVGGKRSALYGTA